MKTVRFAVKIRAGRIPQLTSLLTLWCLAEPLKADFYGDFEYPDHGSGITIDRYLGSGGESVTVSIPASIIGKPVTRLGNFCFRWSCKVTGVLIPESVTSIGDYAFEGCHYLTGITIPGSVNSLMDVSYRTEASADLTNLGMVETSIIGEGAAIIRSYFTGSLPRRFFRTTRN
jgi:hypothetical protein